MSTLDEICRPESSGTGLSAPDSEFCDSCGRRMTVKNSLCGVGYCRTCNGDGMSDLPTARVVWIVWRNGDRALWHASSEGMLRVALAIARRHGGAVCDECGIIEATKVA